MPCKLYIPDRALFVKESGQRSPVPRAGMDDSESRELKASCPLLAEGTPPAIARMECIDVYNS